MTADAIDRALRLLADCALATREARFDRLPGLMAGVEAALARSYRPRAEDAGRLRQLRVRIEENQRLIEAAGRGIHAAHRRIAEVAQSLRSLNTYDSQGRRAVIAPTDSLERKA